MAKQVKCSVGPQPKRGPMRQTNSITKTPDRTFSIGPKPSPVTKKPK